jgi:hypothetical protein
VLRGVVEDGALVLHGSTMLGVDDEFSDLDVWLLIPQSRLAEVDALSPTRFFPFELEGKGGHVNVHAIEEFEGRLTGCDLPLIAELRLAELLIPSDGLPVEELLGRAKSEMPNDVRLAWFQYHYLFMRQAHRALDNPIERGHSATVLFGVSATIEHALQAALVLDGVPYPYVKWLHHAAERSPTGQKIVPLVREMLILLANDGLSHPGPERDHPLSLKLREIRNTLISAAREAGIDETWLETWWLSIDGTRERARCLSWP